MDPNLIEQAYESMPCLESKDVSDAVLYVLSTRPRVQVKLSFFKVEINPSIALYSLQVHELIIKPVGETM